jgi:hypothetical protein
MKWHLADQECPDPVDGDFHSDDVVTLFGQTR